MDAFAALFDPLYFPEEHLDLYHEELGGGAEGAKEHWLEEERQPPAVLDDDLPVLFEAFRAREGAAVVPPPPVAAGKAEDGYGGAAGREAAVGWVCRAAARLGFSALTAALTTVYLKGCFLSGGALRLRD